MLFVNSFIPQVLTLISNMNTKHDYYEAPTTEVVEVKVEGVICLSEEPIPTTGDSWGWDIL